LPTNRVVGCPDCGTNVGTVTYEDQWGDYQHSQTNTGVADLLRACEGQLLAQHKRLPQEPWDEALDIVVRAVSGDIDPGLIATEFTGKMCAKLGRMYWPHYNQGALPSED
jgi:hypothetical protein